jgi:hypothetical protein
MMIEAIIAESSPAIIKAGFKKCLPLLQPLVVSFVIPPGTILHEIMEPLSDLIFV